MNRCLFMFIAALFGMTPEVSCEPRSPLADVPVIEQPAATDMIVGCDEQLKLPPSFGPEDVASRLSSTPAGAFVDETPVYTPPFLYPLCAFMAGIEGECELVFDITPEGASTNILPVCTHRVFEHDAAATLSRWRFAARAQALGPRSNFVARMPFRLRDIGKQPLPPEGERPQIVERTSQEAKSVGGS